MRHICLFEWWAVAIFDSSVVVVRNFPVLTHGSLCCRRLRRLDWHELHSVLANFTGKTANVTWPGTGNAPVQLQLRVQLRRKNENYGQPSDIILVTVIP